MALIHEAIGEIVWDPKGEFEAGERVVMIPNTPMEEDSVIAENYLRTSKFRASGFDGPGAKKHQPFCGSLYRTGIG